MLNASKLELKNRTFQIFSEVKCVDMVAVFEFQMEQGNSKACGQMDSELS